MHLDPSICITEVRVSYEYDFHSLRVFVAFFASRYFFLNVGDMQNNL
jgi:hypothetical protein